MDTNAYIRPLFRWWRLIVIATLLALAISGISALLQPEVYISRTTLIVGTTFMNTNPDSGQLYVAQQLAQIYADMAQREPIQQAAMQALGVERLPKYESSVIPNTLMVEIAVPDTNPERAQIIARELANQLMLQSPAIAGTEVGARQEFIQVQLSSLQEQIQDTEDTIEELQRSLIGLNSASQINKIEGDITFQGLKLNTLRQNYAALLANSQQGALNILSIVEPANLPTRSEGTNKLIIIALAGMVGISLGTGSAYLLEFLDRTIKTASDIERIFNHPVIGYISAMSENGTNKATYIAKNPESILAENIRMLRSNVEYFSNNNRARTILITSPSQGNGKTTVASNLALSISQLEQEVLLVDADLRRSAVHTALKMSKSPGLADVIRNKADIEKVIRPWKKNATLKVITAGNKPPNITEVVGTKKISTILSQLKENHELVIIDAPPLIIADAYNLAAAADGVVIVMEPGQTSDEQAKTIKEQLERVDARILGFVFNKVTEESGQSYGDVQYRSLYSARHYGDYTSEAIKEPATASRSKKLVDFFEYGKLPPAMANDLEHAIAAIKTQPRRLFKRNRKAKKSEG